MLPVSSHISRHCFYIECYHELPVFKDKPFSVNCVLNIRPTLIMKHPSKSYSMTCGEKSWGVKQIWIMMTSSNGNIFRVTGPLCGEFTGPGEFLTQRPVTRSFDVFFDLRLNKGWVNNREAGDLRRHCGHYDVNVMILSIKWYWPVINRNFSVVSQNVFNVDYIKFRTTCKLQWYWAGLWCEFLTLEQFLICVQMNEWLTNLWGSANYQNLPTCAKC